MKHRLLLFAVAAVVAGWAVAAAAGPATSDAGGAFGGSALPALTGTDPLGADVTGGGPSFGGQDAQGTGLSLTPPVDTGDTGVPPSDSSGSSRD